MKKKLLIVLALAVLLTPLIACGKSDFDRQRSAVVDYLTAFNKIYNDLDQTHSTIGPQPASGNPVQINNALTKMASAWQGAMQLVNSLKVPDNEAKAHCEGYQKFLQGNMDAIQKLKDAVGSGSQSGVSQAITSLSALQQQAPSINRSTEALMLKYNITDAEVNYKFRGK